MGEIRNPKDSPGRPVFWVLRDSLGPHHPLGPVIKLGFRHPRKTERKKVAPFEFLSLISLSFHFTSISLLFVPPPPSNSLFTYP